MNDEKITAQLTRSELLTLSLEAAQRFECTRDVADERRRNYFMNLLNIPYTGAFVRRGLASNRSVSPECPPSAPSQES